MKPALHLLALVLAAILASGCVASRAPATKTVAERVQRYGPAARARLLPHFQRAGITYPPQRVALVGLKSERTLQLYAAGGSGWKFIRAYPILGASGGLGPKLREGDRQVPEGIYPIDLLNPNSRHEIAMQIGYPNAFDREQAAREGRTDLGGEIMIHGGHSSIGCLAVGDDVSAELFVLAADTGLANVTVILAPVDFRTGSAVSEANRQPAWTTELYAQIKTRLAELPPAKNP
ncbi:MAG: L,D-transpeptidase family protein [Verrucomicrobia bacterium]|nr:L,D-transpeptidase family protein [Verrucomicrobiota bacterium]